MVFIISFKEFDQMFGKILILFWFNIVHIIVNLLYVTYRKPNGFTIDSGLQVDQHGFVVSRHIDQMT